MTTDPICDTFSVILIRPIESLNIGSVARGMANLGFNDLRIVDPENYDLQRARITARTADSILESSRVYSSLSEAIRDCNLVVGFSNKVSKNRIEPILLPNWVGNIEVVGKKIGLLFGREDTGLGLNEIEQCSTLVAIPTWTDYDSFNLSQAVLLALYQIRLEFSKQDTKKVETSLDKSLASWAELNQLDLLIDEVLTLSKFYNKGTSDAIPRLAKNIFKRLELETREAAILLGIFSRISKELKRK
jgi:TrmH family RNA methyltransferase